MSSMPPEQGQALGLRDLADFYMNMYLEHLAFARHHEVQRSAATTMFFGIPVLLLAIGTALSKDGYPLLLGIGLLMVALGGVLLSLKLFERSAST